MSATVLSVIEDDVLGPRFIQELLALIDTAPADERARLSAERDRLRGEIHNLVASVAKRMPAETIAPVVREYEAELARLEVRLRQPHRDAPDRERLRAALEQRAADWKADLRAEPTVARLMVRRILGPLTIAVPDPPADFILKDWPKAGDPQVVPIGLGEDLLDEVSWQAPVKSRELIDGLTVQVDKTRWFSELN